MKARSSLLHKQQGVAVITALLLTTLAVTIVASLFWQQQVPTTTVAKAMDIARCARLGELDFA
jgi:type II secretory pathway component PulK